MINYVTLTKKLQKYRITDNSQLPWAYQKANPQGRPLHDDWQIPWLPSVIQPWSKIPRIWSAYRVPLPLKQLSGPTFQDWIPWDGKYPFAPGTQQKTQPYYYKDYRGFQASIPVTYILADQPESPGSCVFAAYLDGEWVECYHLYQKDIFGKRFLFSQGLRPDVTISVEQDGSIKSDYMCWYPEICCTYIKP